MKRTGTAHWQGTLREGKGLLNTESGAVSNAHYSFGRRFENDKGTNPEELIAAAHAGCFAMAFSAELQKKDFNPKSIDVEASVELEKKDSWSITRVHLEMSADVPDISPDEFEELSEVAKTNCPVSKLLKAEISLKASLITPHDVHPGKFAADERGAEL